ncbi:hypothetical protein WN55_00312, partial [Dufourea novaeangliae]
RIIIFQKILKMVRFTFTDENFRCYMCTSLTNPGCDTDPQAHNIEPVKCTLNNMKDWERTVQQHRVLSSLSHIFDVDHSWNHQAYAPLACAKMVLKVNKTEVIVRSCQTAKTETIDPCKAIQGKFNNDLSSLEHCDLCMQDACNSSIGLTPRIRDVLLSVLGTVILAAIYNGA